MNVIDVLIPTYRPKRAHLTEALKSLQVQTFKDFSVLIHDEPVESETEDIVRPFLSDPRFRFERSPVRLGIGGNWNACFKKTFSPIVAYLFQDDLWEPTYLENAMRVLENNATAGFVSLGHEYRTEDGQELGPLYAGLHEFRSKELREGLHPGREFLRFWIDRELTPNVIGEPDFVVMRRSVMEKAGPFHMSMPQFLDTEYWIRLLQITDWYCLKGNHGTFRLHPSAASTVNQESGKGLYDRFECFEELIQTLKGEDRALAIRARNRAFETMVGKFFQRMKSGKKISTQGSGGMKGFVLRHPVLFLRAVFKNLFTPRSRDVASRGA